jgi:hypothetical protein
VPRTRGPQLQAVTRAQVAVIALRAEPSRGTGPSGVGESDRSIAAMLLSLAAEKRQPRRPGSAMKATVPRGRPFRAEEAFRAITPRLAADEEQVFPGIGA